MLSHIHYPMLWQHSFFTTWNDISKIKTSADYQVCKLSLLQQSTLLQPRLTTGLRVLRGWHTGPFKWCSVLDNMIKLHTPPTHILSPTTTLSHFNSCHPQHCFIWALFLMRLPQENRSCASFPHSVQHVSPSRFWIFMYCMFSGAEPAALGTGQVVGEW